MKTSTLAALAAMAFLPLSLAQDDPGPSPSESIGCEPHGDHWHCEGPRETASAAGDDESSSVDPGPSPTASIGCEPHGDHWHCEGPATTGASAAAPSGTEESDHDHDHDEDHDHEHDDHDDEEHDTAAAGPSPTESVGCEPRKFQLVLSTLCLELYLTDLPRRRPLALRWPS